MGWGAAATSVFPFRMATQLTPGRVFFRTGPSCRRSGCCVRSWPLWAAPWSHWCTWSPPGPTVWASQSHGSLQRREKGFSDMVHTTVVQPYCRDGTVYHNIRQAGVGESSSYHHHWKDRFIWNMIWNPLKVYVFDEETLEITQHTILSFQRT